LRSNEISDKGGQALLEALEAQRIEGGAPHKYLALMLDGNKKIKNKMILHKIDAILEQNCCDFLEGDPEAGLERKYRDQFRFATNIPRSCIEPPRTHEFNFNNIFYEDMESCK